MATGEEDDEEQYVSADEGVNSVASDEVVCFVFILLLSNFYYTELEIITSIFFILLINNLLCLYLCKFLGF